MLILATGGKKNITGTQDITLNDDKKPGKDIFLKLKRWHMHYLLSVSKWAGFVFVPVHEQAPVNVIFTLLYLPNAYIMQPAFMNELLLINVQ